MEPQPVRIEELLAHAGWVRKLAARMVRDAGTADDVSQEVWTKALRSPPRDRENLRAWLAAAVRNTARSLKRAETRRRDHEAAVEITRDEPPASELVERAPIALAISWSRCSRCPSRSVRSFWRIGSRARAWPRSRDVST
jgi:DNA-directed RNA polymerase specialized sigma24 family protein